MNDIELLQQQIRRKQESLSKMDQNILQQLARQELLEQLYDGSSISSASRSGLSQSSISSNNHSSTSVNSSFLEKEIKHVHEYFRKNELPKEIDETHARTKEIVSNRHHHPLRHENNRTTREDREEYSSFFKQTRKQEDVDLQAIRREHLKMVERLEQEEKERELKQFLEERDRMRQQKLQQQRRQIREQLIKQQYNNKQNITTPSYKQQSGFHIPFTDNPCLKQQRNKALSHLLRQVQRSKQATASLLNKTRVLAIY